jgi:hypothetical protein
MPHLSKPILKLASVILSLLALPARALKRTAGPPDDFRFVRAAEICNGNDAASFRFGTCSVLIDCVYKTLTEAFKANLNSGASIVALLPTILVLTGEELAPVINDPQRYF